VEGALALIKKLQPGYKKNNMFVTCFMAANFGVENNKKKQPVTEVLDF
jgi:hypothetical protein